MKVLIIGGSDVDARIPLIEQMKGEACFMVAGSQDQSPEPFRKAGIEFRSYPMLRSANPIADIYMLIVLIRLIHSKSLDIVHTFDTKPGVWGRLAAHITGVPVVVGTLPGLGSLYSNSGLRTLLIRAIYRPLQSLACRLSELTIFQNQADAEQFIKDRVVPRHKTAIINGSGVQTAVYDPRNFSLEQRHQTRINLALDEKKTVVVMISRLIRSKGVLEFAQAARAIQEQYPETIFLLVGSDDYQSVDVLTPRERELIKKSVTFLGERKDVPELLAISDIVVLPTYYREGIPRVLLEAASMGLPIVATNVPGCTEVVEHDANGFLVAPRDTRALRDAIEMLVVNPLLRKRFGAVSRLRAITSFDLSIIARQTTQTYRQLLREKLHGKQTDS